MGLKLCRNGTADTLSAMHVDDGEWQGRPPPALLATAQYYKDECAKAGHNHEALEANFVMVAASPCHPWPPRPRLPLQTLAPLTTRRAPSPPLATRRAPSPPLTIRRAPSQVAKQPGRSLKECLLEPLEAADIAVMGSIELSNFEREIHLGSMAQAVARQSSAHVMIVKNYAVTAT